MLRLVALCALWRTATCVSVNVSSGGQLFRALSDPTVTDIYTRATINTDPYVWCSPGEVLRIDRAVTLSAPTSTVWDVYDVSKTRLASMALGPCISVSINGSLTLQGAFELYSDVSLVQVIDFVEYLGFLDLGAPGTISFLSVSITGGPTSDMPLLQQSLTQGGIDAVGDDQLLTINRWDNPRGSFVARDVHINRAREMVISTTQELQVAMRSAGNRFIVIQNDLNLEEWTDNTVVGWPVTIRTNATRVFDTAGKQAVITTRHGGAVRFRGPFVFINCVTLTSRFYEEGLLQFVYLNTGATVTDPTLIDGICTVENATVYGNHQSPLWLPSFSSLFPVCADLFKRNFSKPAPNMIQVTVLQVNTVSFYNCTANTSVKSESYRLLKNISLPIGSYVPPGQDANRLRAVIGTVVPISFGVLLLCTGCIYAYKRRTQRAKLGLGAHMQNTAKQVLGDVQLSETLGWGSFGRVYRAIWEGREVAVKVGHPVQVTEEKDPLQEAKITETLQHHNIVQTLKYTHRDVDHHGDDSHSEVVLVEPWYVMEYCDGGTLQTAIQADLFHHTRKLKLAWVLQCARDVASALTYLHGIGIMHGDLTCANIMVMSDKQDPRGFHLKVADFGQAQVFSKWIAKNRSVQTYGTVTHQPPEVLMQGTLSPAADVWAYGMLMYELFTGSPPYKQFIEAQMIYVITVTKHLPPVPAHCPQDYKDLMSACWQKAEQRPTFPVVSQRVNEMLRKYS